MGGEQNLRKVDIPAQPPTRVKTTEVIAEATPVPKKMKEEVNNDESTNSEKQRNASD